MKDRAFSALWATLGQRRGLLVLAVACAAVAQIAGIPLALLTRRMVQSVLDGDLAHSGVWPWGAALAALAAVQGISRWSGAVCAERVAQGTIADLRVRMLEVLHRKRLDELDGRAAGKTLVRFIGDAAGLRSWIARAVVMTPADVVAVVAVMATLSVLHWQLAVAAAAPLLVVPVVAVALNRHIRERTRAVRREQTRLAGDITDSLEVVGALQAAGAEDRSVAGMAERVRSIEDGFVARRRLDATLAAVATTAGAFALCAIGVAGARLILAGGANVGDVMVAIWLALLLRGPVRRLSTASLLHQRARVSGERIAALLASAPGDAESGDAGAARYTGLGHRVRCKKLGVRDGQRRWVLRDLTVTVTGPGCFRVAGSAAQRGALFEAMLRLRKPTRGRVALDGTDAAKLRPEELRDRIGWVDGRRAMVRATLDGERRSELDARWDLTAALAPGAELGDALQRPEHAEPALALRLAVTCALARDPALLLLDDPTRALDGSERARFARWVERFGHDHLVLIGSEDTSLDGACRGVLDLEASSVVSRIAEEAWPKA